jgi:hypothetical protein
MFLKGHYEQAVHYENIDCVTEESVWIGLHNLSTFFPPGGKQRYIILEPSLPPCRSKIMKIKTTLRTKNEGITEVEIRINILFFLTLLIFLLFVGGGSDNLTS